MEQSIHAAKQHARWNRGKLVGQKAPLKLKDIWAIRVRLQIGERTRELALFNLALDSKLRSCDLVKLRVRDVCHGSLVAARAMVMQQKTQRPVQFEITEQTRESLLAWIRAAGRRSDDYLFPSRIHGSPHLSTRQYARIVRGCGRNRCWGCAVASDSKYASAQNAWRDAGGIWQWGDTDNCGAQPGPLALAGSGRVDAFPKRPGGSPGAITCAGAG